MRFAIFPLHLSKVQRLPRKIDARSYEVLHLSRKIILANLQIWCSKMQPVSGNQRLDLLTSLMNMSFVLRLPRDMHLCRSSSSVPRLPSFLEMLQNPHVLLTFEKVHNPLRLPRETTSERPKVVRTWCVLYILTSKRASRHNGVHFFIANPDHCRSNPRFGVAEQCFATFLPFCAPGSSFFWDFLFLLLFSSVTLPISAFHLSILSEVWFLNFLRLCWWFWRGLSSIWSSIKRWLGLGESSPTGRWGWCFLLVQIKWKGLTNWPFGRWLVLFVEAWLYFGNIKHYFSTLAQQEGENSQHFYTSTSIIRFHVFVVHSCFVFRGSQVPVKLSPSPSWGWGQTWCSI